MQVCSYEMFIEIESFQSNVHEMVSGVMMIKIMSILYSFSPLTKEISAKASIL